MNNITILFSEVTKHHNPMISLHYDKHAQFPSYTADNSQTLHFVVMYVYVCLLVMLANYNMC